MHQPRPRRAHRRPGRGPRAPAGPSSAASTACRPTSTARSWSPTATCRCSPRRRCVELLEAHAVERQRGDGRHRPASADPTGYGRVVRDADGASSAIVEQKDATPEQLAVTEVNSGLYAFDLATLRESLAARRHRTTRRARSTSPTSSGSPARGGLTVRAHPLDDVWQTEGVNDRVQLARLGARAEPADPASGSCATAPRSSTPPRRGSTSTSRVGTDTVIRPHTQIHGASTIGADCVIGPDTTLDGRRGRRRRHGRADRRRCLAVIGPGANVGPYSYLRPGTGSAPRARSAASSRPRTPQIGDGAKVPHLTYAGDVTIGEKANIGAGHDLRQLRRRRKHHSRVGAGTVRR